MSDSSGDSAGEQRQTLAEAFDREIDPLTEFEETFEETEIDPFDLFFEKVIAERDIADSTVEEYERVVRQWKDHMEEIGRHPACPAVKHVDSFAEKFLDKGNRPDDPEKKLYRLNRAFSYWQADPAFPHDVDYNPFEVVLKRKDFEVDPIKDPPRIPVSELGEMVRSVRHIRDRAIVVTGLKLGLRASEICNLKLQDIDLTNSELVKFYDDLGSHPLVREYENAVFVASKHERERNKSSRPRVLPTDEELRRVLIRWLLIRPDTGSPWVFLSKQKHTQLQNEGVNNVWKDNFHPEYGESEYYRAVTSHFARHRFSTFWNVEQELNREWVRYMRGDEVGSGTLDTRSAIDEYLHTYYEDIEDVYRERIYKFHV